MNEDSGEFSEGLDEFENSIDETRHKNLKNQTTYSNKPYDEAFEVSQDLSMAESFDGRDKVKSMKSMLIFNICLLRLRCKFYRIPKKRN